jgi:hypothetical protein
VANGQQFFTNYASRLGDNVVRVLRNPNEIGAALTAVLPCILESYFTLSPASGPDPSSQYVAETIVIDGNAPPTPFPHFLDRMFGSGGRILALRES